MCNSESVSGRRWYGYLYHEWAGWEHIGKDVLFEMEAVSRLLPCFDFSRTDAPASVEFVCTKSFISSDGSRWIDPKRLVGPSQIIALASVSVCFLCEENSSLEYLVHRLVILQAGLAQSSWAPSRKSKMAAWLLLMGNNRMELLKSHWNKHQLHAHSLRPLDEIVPLHGPDLLFQWPWLFSFELRRDWQLWFCAADLF